ncbi:hypothetical protein KAR91_09295 [Candidatus Pacearchaeota archaeon]|nr:hypothetical protein [Candidatus Pacearchaeota archaeon]
MSENLAIWNKLKDPPKNVMKKIKGGRLKGMTDISPQWRYKAMTEQFGPVGVGWTYTIVKTWIEGGANGTVCAFVEVALIYKADNKEWSQPVPGIGGSMLTAKETAGLYTSDECFKMAETDALSVAMKKIGVGASVYLGEAAHDTKPPNEKPDKNKMVDDEQLANIDALVNEVGANLEQFCAFFNIEQMQFLPSKQYEVAIKMLEKKRRQ